MSVIHTRANLNNKARYASGNIVEEKLDEDSESSEEIESVTQVEGGDYPEIPKQAASVEESYATSLSSYSQEKYAKRAKKKPLPIPPNIVTSNAGTKDRVFIKPPSPLVQQGPLYVSPSEITVHCSKIPSLLWDGGFVWKIPFNGRSNPEHRIVAVKRASFPGIYSRRVQIVNHNGDILSTKSSSFICYPPTLIWYSSHEHGELQNARELVLYEGSYISEGHNTPAFWKLVSKSRPVPRPELCFSVVTSTRTLDLACESSQEALDWKSALVLFMQEFLPDSSQLNSAIRTAGWKPPGGVVLSSHAAPPIPPPLPPAQAPNFPPPPPETSQTYSSAVPAPRPPQNLIPKGPLSAPNDDKKQKKELQKTKLFEAASSNNYQSMLEILRSGTSVDLLDSKTHDTPLMIACRSGFPDIVKLCLQFGAKNDPHPDFGETALHAAVNAVQIPCVEVVLEAAASAEANAIITNLADPHGRTVLHVAASKQNAELLELLLENGADPNKLDDVGLTPVHIAAGTGDKPSLAVLLDHGGDASIDQPDTDGNTPLHHAASNGHLSCVRYLLETAADCQAKNFNGQTAYNLASVQGHHQTGLLLLEYQHQSWPWATWSNNGSTPNASGSAGIGKVSPLVRDYSSTSVHSEASDASRSSTVSVEVFDVSSSPQPKPINSTYPDSGGTPMLQRKISDELLPRPHTSSSPQLMRSNPSLPKPIQFDPTQFKFQSQTQSQSFGVNFEDRMTPIKISLASPLMNRQPMTLSARENTLSSPSASELYAPMSARLSTGTPALFKGLQFNGAVRSEVTAVDTPASALSGKSLDFMGKSYSPQRTPNLATTTDDSGFDYEENPMYENYEFNDSADYIQVQSTVDDTNEVEGSAEGYQGEGSFESYRNDLTGAESSDLCFEYEDDVWDIYVTDEGYTYYLNRSNCHSQWWDPREYGVVFEPEYEVTTENAVIVEDPASVVDAKTESVVNSEVLENKAPRIRMAPSSTPERMKLKAGSNFVVKTPPRVVGGGSSGKKSRAVEDSTDLVSHEFPRTSFSDSDSDEGSNVATIRTTRRIGTRASPDDKLKSKKVPLGFSQPAIASSANISVGYTEGVALSAFKNDHDVKLELESQGKEIIGTQVEITAVVEPSPIVVDIPRPTEARMKLGIPLPAPLLIPAKVVPNTSLKLAQSPLSDTTTPLSKPAPAAGRDQNESIDDLIHHPFLGKYAKMFSIGIPKDSITTRMELEGIDEQERLRFSNAMASMKPPARSPANRNRVSKSPVSSLESKEHKDTVTNESKSPHQSISKAVDDFNPDSKLKPTPRHAHQSKLESKDGDIVDSLGPASSRPLHSSINTPSHRAHVDLSNELEFIENKEEFDKLFGASVDTNTTTVSRSSSSGEKAALLVVDSRRAQSVVNCLTSLKSVGSHPLMLGAICSLDTLGGKLTRDHLDQFIELIPTEAEIHQAPGMARSKHAAEAFLMLASSFCPYLPRRLNIFISCENFVPKCESVSKQIAVLDVVCRKILSSDALMKFLQRLTVVKGMLDQNRSRNRTGLAAASPFAGSSGFSLDSLLRIINMKGADRRTSVLDYIVKNVIEKEEDLVDQLLADLTGLDGLNDFSSVEISKKTTEFKTALDCIRDEHRIVSKFRGRVDSPSSSNAIASSGPVVPCNEPYCRRLEHYVGVCSTSISNLLEAQDKLHELSVDLVSYLGAGESLLSEECLVVKIASALNVLKLAVAASRERVQASHRK